MGEKAKATEPGFSFAAPILVIGVVSLAVGLGSASYWPMAIGLTTIGVTAVKLSARW